MKKNIFPIWLKEFCSLVFTQAVQAFLLAVVMSVIIAMITEGSTAEAGTSVSATGVIAIVALTAISKIELLVKKIFGIESQFGDPSMKSGAAGIAGTLIGARLAGRVLNNAGKVGSGINDALKGRQAQAQARARLANNLNKLNSKYPQAGVEGAQNPAQQALGTPQMGAANPEINNYDANNPNINAGGNTTIQDPTGAIAGAVSGAVAGAMPNTVAGGNTTLNPNTISINANNVELDGKTTDKNATYEDKKQEIMDKYNDEIDKAKAQSRQGFYKIGSGVAETVGAIPGAAAGAVYGMATGDGIARNAGVGMGIGDFIGETTVNVIQSTHETARQVNNTRSSENKAVDAVRELTGKDISNYKSSIRELESYTQRLDNASNNAQKQVDAGNI